MEFTYRSYNYLLSKVKAKSFKFVTYGDFDGKKNIVLKHDVDFSLDKALETAIIDNLNGLKSYFSLW